MPTASPPLVARWRFDDQTSTNLPADEVGNVEPLRVATGLAMPGVTTGRLGGYARDFTGGSKGMAARCVDADAMALRRSVTVEVLVKYVSNNLLQSVIAHGRDTSTAERRTWELFVGFNAVDHVLRFGWTRTTGTTAVNVEIAFTPPSDGWMHIVAVREWISATSVQVHWYLNRAYLGTSTSTDGDIDDGTDGEVMVGARYSGGIYGSQFRGLIDFVQVYDGVMSMEEAQHRYDALFVYPDQLLELVRASLPPGQSYSTDPASRIQRQLTVFADGLAAAWSKAIELSTYFHPDVAWSLLERWEAITRLSPLPTDSLATRRTRIVSHLRKIHGYTRDDIKVALREVLALDDADIDIVENSNIMTDTFAALESWWTSEARAGTVGVAGGKLDLDAGIGTDVRWDGTNDKAVRVRTPLPEAFKCELVAAFQLGALPASCFAGIYQLDLATGNFQIYGLYNQAGNLRLWTRKVVSGVVDDVFGTANPIGAATTYWLRAVDTGNGIGGTIVAPYYRLDGSGLDDGWLDGFTTDPYNISTPRGWWGLCVGSDLSSLVAGISVDVLEVRAWCPQWDGVYDWMIYRDPAIVPTSYDRVGAQQVVDRMKPAHTRGTVIESLAAVAGSPYSRVGGVPVGG